MVEADLSYVRGLLAARLIADPVLELGVGYGGATCRQLLLESGLTYYGTDLEPGNGVDFVADFTNRDDMAVFAQAAPFGTVLVLNVLEHTFDALALLDNACTLLRHGGTLVTITPAVWPLHDHPIDVQRLLPNFFEEFARRRGLCLVPDHFEYVGFGRVSEFRNLDGSYRFPPPTTGKARHIYGRIVHKVLNTFGRGMFQPSHIEIGATFVAAG